MDQAERCGNVSFVGCCQHSLLGYEEKALYMFVFPGLLLLSIAGNFMNTVLYQQPFLASSSTVRLLLFRALANLCFPLSLVPNLIYAWHNSDRHSRIYELETTDEIEQFYWNCLKYMSFASNVLNTISVWLTMAVTVQLLALITWPHWAKQSLSMSTAHWIVSICLPASVLVHLPLVTSRAVIAVQCRRDPSLVVYRYLSSSSPAFDTLYYYATATLIHVFPLAVLCLSSLFIAWQMFGRHRRQHSPLGHSSPDRTRCVLHLAAATTVCHLVFEFPTAIVLMLAGIFPIVEHSSRFQTFVAISNFLSIFNAALPFLLYNICSRRYRVMSLEIIARWTGLILQQKHSTTVATDLR